ncbi:rhomboid family intramembrane serine protease [Roseibacillus ishigakijimensis]|uniref:Rhomboid family intramembrane serine protease n=1 Tax=Roseibacillus ishigakijimensis TaxID=454146 RepID=A0A934RQ60_9BACT|nr:rhomboid family intramembrane serine protease [Roseibacillus ishigakijimensis]MBK1833561.1 rhomboid family intramembrane serine protease [Roseibacillus ishigakijimensis]
MAWDSSTLRSTSSSRRLSRPGCGLILTLVVLAWLVEVADQVFHFFGFPLDALGIWPRQPRGLVGVITSPWLHGNWLHLINNTVAFVGLGFFVLVAEGRRFLATTFWLVLLSGLGTWLIGRGGSVHIGASGLIYGYFGYLLMRAWTERKPAWIAAGIFIALVYGGMVWGVLPSEAGVSWEAHLCGFVGGLWLGRNHGLLSHSRGKWGELDSL